MLKEIIIAVQSYLRAHRFIRQHKLWKWVFVPGVVYALLFAASLILFGTTASRFIQWIFAVTQINGWIAHHPVGWLHFLFAFATFILWLLLVLLYFSLFKYVWLIVGSPLFAYLSAKTEAIIQGRDTPFTAKLLWADVWRGIAVALRNMVWQTVYLFSLLLLSVVPVAGWITPVVALLIEGYYYGFSMLDYSGGRRQMSLPQSIYFMGRHRGLAIGNGIVFYTMHLVPIIGWMLAPAYAVVAATLSMIKVTDENREIV